MESIGSMPNVYRYGLTQLEKALRPIVDDGLKYVLLFGVPESLSKVF